MGDVVNITGGHVASTSELSEDPVGAGNGGGGGMDELNQRVTALEHDITIIKTRLEHELPHLATKADLNDLKAEVHSIGRQMIMWSVGSILAASGLVIAILRFVPASTP